MQAYLAGFENGTAGIIIQEKSPFMTHIDGLCCNSCYGGMDEADLRSSSEIPDEPCRKCGSPFATTYSNKEDLLKRHFCFSCTFWQEYVEDKDNPRIARVDGKHYFVNKSKGGDTRFNGFGGSKFKVRWNDGREEESNDVWHQGTIPDRFRQDLPDNATFQME